MDADATRQLFSFAMSLPVITFLVGWIVGLFAKLINAI